ncbi:hypothetical protein OS21_31270 [Dickeya oryzae]
MSDLQQHALNYYRQQQLPPGWADLFGVIVNGMMDSAGEQEGLAFFTPHGQAIGGALCIACGGYRCRP